MYFKKSLCRVSDLALGKPVFAECFFFAECWLSGTPEKKQSVKSLALDKDLFSGSGLLDYTLTIHLLYITLFMFINL
jgi:hypothetical protein